MTTRPFILAVLLGALAWGGPAYSATAPLTAAVPTKTTAAAPAAREDIRDIRGPIAIPAWWRWLKLAGGCAIAVGLGCGAVLVYRRRRPRALTPEEQALALLDQSKVLAEAGKPREYALAASDAVRFYIEQRFGLRAAHSTTDEFLLEIAGDPKMALSAQRDALMQFLLACDLAKFARYELGSANMQSLHELARQFVLTAAREPNQARPTSGSPS